MRILIYTRPFAPMTGGQETVLWDLAVGLAGARQGDGIPAAQVTVATQAARNGFDDAALPFRIVRQPSWRALVALIRAADVVHLAGPAFLPIVAALALRKPVAVEHHGFQTICPNGQLIYEPDQSPCPGHFRAGRHRECLRCNGKTGRVNSIRMWLLTFPRRWLCTRVQSNIMPTNWLGELLQMPRATTVYHSLPERGMVSAVRQEKPQRSADNANLCATGSGSDSNDGTVKSRRGMQSAHTSALPATGCDARTFAYVGRLVGTKGLPILLRAARELRAAGVQFKLKVIGKGSDREALERQAVDLGLADCVEFLGYLAPDELEEQLAQAATVVMPSLAGEVFGMVAAENMLRGKLVIVSDIGAMREVAGDAGMTFAPGDVKALAACMRRVLDEPGLAPSLGEKARQRALRVFREERMVAEHLAVYRQISGMPSLSPALNANSVASPGG